MISVWGSPVLSGRSQTGDSSAVVATTRGCRTGGDVARHAPVPLSGSRPWAVENARLALGLLRHQGPWNAVCPARNPPGFIKIFSMRRLQTTAQAPFGLSQQACSRCRHVGRFTGGSRRGRSYHQGRAILHLPGWRPSSGNSTPDAIKSTIAGRIAKPATDGALRDQREPGLTALCELIKRHASSPAAGAENWD